MKGILVAVDFSNITEAVIQQASTLAKRLKAKVWVVHVTSDKLQAAAYTFSPMYSFTPEMMGTPFGDIEMARDLCAEQYKREHHALLGLSAKLREDGADAQAILLKGNAADLIVKKAVEIEAGVIVIGSHGHGMLHKVVVGSVSESVLRKAPCNVLIVPAPHE